MRARLLLLTATLAMLLIGLASNPLSQARASAAAPQRVAKLSPPVNPNYPYIKAATGAGAPRGDGKIVSSSNAPITGTNWDGLAWDNVKNNTYPSDSNGAIGPTEYIEVVNNLVGVYDRTNPNPLLSSNTLDNWVNPVDPNSLPCISLGDPVIMYSAPEQRFYFAEMCSVADGLALLWGFSKGPAPSANNFDWCFYDDNFGGRYSALLPDYPRLGDSATDGTNPGFILIGVNAFKYDFQKKQKTTYVGSDLAWIKKPPLGFMKCPGKGNFGAAFNVFINLKVNGNDAFTPNPAKQADANATGVVLANKSPGGGTSKNLFGYTVTHNNNGSAKLSAATTITVSQYQQPPAALQCNSIDTLDTSDARLMSAWMAKDESQDDQFFIWTGHTVKASAGGMGSEFRWYKYDMAFDAARRGKVQLSDRYVFMGAIAPNRDGATGNFGHEWGATVNTSSGTQCVTVSAADENGITDIFKSTTPETDGCVNNNCRFGDYSGASPDPAPKFGGEVWGTGMYSKGLNNGWGSWNFEATPSFPCITLPAIGVIAQNNKAIVIGGNSFASAGCVDGNSAQSWIFDPSKPAGTRWTQSGDLTQARGYITPAFANGKVYAIGGDVNNGGTLSAQSTVDVYSPATGTWSAGPGLPEACDESQAFTFASGGTTYVDLPGCGQWPSALAHTWLLNASTQTWTAGNPLNVARRNQAGFTAGKYMVILGGYDSSGLNVLNSSEYSPPTPLIWQLGPTSPFYFTRFDGQTVGNTVYFLGGRDQNNNTDGTIWKLDLTTKQFSQTGATMAAPISNYQIALLTFNGKNVLFTFGGRLSDGTISTTVQYYDPSTNTVNILTSDPWPGTIPSQGTARSPTHPTTPPAHDAALY